MFKSAFIKRKNVYLLAFAIVLIISFIFNNYRYLFQPSNHLLNLSDSLKTDYRHDNPELDTDSIKETKNTRDKKEEQHNISPSESRSSLPDFKSKKNITLKKRAFFHFLSPYIAYENGLILKQREFIKEQSLLLETRDSLAQKDITLLKKYLVDYRCINSDLSNPETFKELLEHVDIIPQELALVQAALESSWGTSYFAKKANNLFGQWCFTPGCGIVPRARRNGDVHEVEKFKSIDLSVKSYMLFLNSHPAFDVLRKERAINRLHKEKPSALKMANGLIKYSAKGEAYIKDVKSMIRWNKKNLTEAINPDSQQDISIQKQDLLLNSN
ncbi:MAG: glucosaminidase domain-containing protein [Bacteroidales bacterium]|nr:glucosaminidase domain-containing protein [Bacteroidales bacterium]